MLETLIPLGINLASSLFSSNSGKSTNREAAESAQKSMDFEAQQAELNRTFSADQAKRQMDFQQYNSDTMHQRQVKDLVAAGLNPVLSANSGASTPGGASGSGFMAGGKTYTPENPYGDTGKDVSSGVKTSMEAMMMKSQIANVNANTAKTVAETKPKAKLAEAIDRMTDWVGNSASWLGKATANINLPDWGRKG